MDTQEMGDIKLITRFQPVDEERCKVEFEVYIKSKLVSSPVLITKFGKEAHVSLGEEREGNRTKDFTVSCIATPVATQE